jgi:hypothetical protein
MIMRGYGLKPAGIEGNPNVFAVTFLQRSKHRPGNVLGWLVSLPSGWHRWGYENDNPPLLRSLGDAIADLIEYDAWEQDTADWPAVRG